jgi:hypothetical protein
VYLLLGFFPPIAIYGFWKNVFPVYSTRIWYDFLQGNEYYGTSGNTSVVMYMCVETCSSSPFWLNVGGINVSITTAKKLPQAYPLLILEQKLRILVVDQELLLRRSHFEDTMSITKFSLAI